MALTVKPTDGSRRRAEVDVEKHPKIDPPTTFPKAGTAKVRFKSKAVIEVDALTRPYSVCTSQLPRRHDRFWIVHKNSTGNIVFGTTVERRFRSGFPLNVGAIKRPDIARRAFSKAPLDSHLGSERI